MKHVLRFIAMTLVLAAGALPLRAQAQQSADVPYVTTPSNVVETMLEMAVVGSYDYLIDLGSGDGRIVIEAAKKYGARGMGVEIDANLVFTANEAAKRQGVARQVTFVQGNLFYADIGRGTVLTMYLLPQINLQLRPRILAQMRPGSRVMSHDFNMGDWKPDDRRDVPVPNKSYGPPSSAVYLWYVPADVAGKWQWRLPVWGVTRLYEATVRQTFQELSGEALIDGGTATGYNARLRGDLVAFTLEREIAGQKVRHEFSGRVEGDKIIGRVTISGANGESTLDWEATRVVRGKMQIE